MDATERLVEAALKIKLARAQLGTALDLFTRDKDPYLVHALACGGCELIEGVAETYGHSTLSTHILETHPNIDMRRIRALRNQHWNAIKHFYSHDRQTSRHDEDLMASFTDSQNDMPLFMGWFDYVQVVGKLPIAAQVFQVWWYAVYEEKLSNDEHRRVMRSLFPQLYGAPRQEQKRRLRRAIEKYRLHNRILDDPRTEHIPLCAPATPKRDQPTSVTLPAGGQACVVGPIAT